MTSQLAGTAPATGRESGPVTLQRGLRSRQISMIAIGGAVGTGLFLGSAVTLNLAGRAAVVTYAVGAVVALAVIYAAIEMAIAHPDVNGFGGMAHRYLGPLAGFVVRWLYWVVVTVTMGAEAVAVGVYLRYWWPGLPLWIPVLVAAGAVVAANLATVRLFGNAEYWLSMIKVSAIVVFLVLGVTYLVAGLPGRPSPGLSAWTDSSSFLPHGLAGLGTAMIFTMFSYGGTEAVALTANESVDPRRDLPKAARWTVLRLGLFYVLTIFVIVSALAALGTPTGELAASPFVVILDWVGLPAAAAVMNFVVLTAALSALNTLMYVAVRTLYSLGVDGQAPAFTSTLSRRAVPTGAVLASAGGVAVAAAVSALSPDTAFAKMLGVSSFGGLACWALILATYLVFRRRRAGGDGDTGSGFRLAGGVVTSTATLAVLVAVLVGMAFVPTFRDAWYVGAPFVLAIVAAYLVTRRRRTAG